VRSVSHCALRLWYMDLFVSIAVYSDFLNTLFNLMRPQIILRLSANIRPEFSVSFCNKHFWDPTDWQWQVWGGRALMQLLLIIAADGGKWSDFLICNHFSIRQRTPGTDWIWGWVGLWTSLNFCRGKNLLYLRGIGPVLSIP